MTLMPALGGTRLEIRKFRNKKQTILAYVLLAIPFAIYLFHIIIPLFTSIGYSFTKWKGVGTPKFIGLDNYRTLFDKDDFWLVTKNTVIIAIYCVIGQVGISLIIAFLMTMRKLKFKGFHRAVIFFPSVMAPVVIGYIWKFVYNSQYGILNTLLKAVGLEGWIKPWLDDPDIILKTISIPIIWQYVGLYMVIMVSAISAVPQEIYEMAEIDGASGIKKSLYITLPMITNTLKVAIILCFSGAMKVYDHIYIMTNGGPGRSSATMALYCYQTTFDFGKFGLGAAVAVMLLAFSLLASFIIQLLLGGKRNV